MIPSYKEMMFSILRFIGERGSVDRKEVCKFVAEHYKFSSVKAEPEHFLMKSVLCREEDGLRLAADRHGPGHARGYRRRGHQCLLFDGVDFSGI